MVERETINIIKSYLHRLNNSGLDAHRAILFGSYVHNESIDEWSDIDLLVLSSKFDDQYTREDVNMLWRLASDVDSRIEPIAVGEKQWLTDRENPIIEVARMEGVTVKID